MYEPSILTNTKENTMEINTIEFKSNAVIINEQLYTTYQGWWDHVIPGQVGEYVKSFTLEYERDLEEIVNKGLDRYKTLHTVKKALYLTGNTNHAKYYKVYIAKSKPNRVALIPKDKFIHYLKDWISGWLYQKPKELAQNLVEDIIEKGFKEWFLTEPRIWLPIPDENWLRKNGVLIKTGKLLRLCVPNLSPDEVQIAAQFVQKELDINAGLCTDIVQISDKPSEVYTIPGFKYEESCMSNKAEEFFRIYDDIEACKIAYIVEEGELRARALLWHCTDGHKIMDRIYSKSGNFQTTMMLWARAHKYLHKTHQAQGFYTYTDGEDTFELPELSVEAGFTFEESMYKRVPYMDTFHCIIEDGTELHSWTYNEKLKRTAILKNVNGNGGFLTPYIRCINCDEMVEEDEVQWYGEEPYCEPCFSDNFLYCEECDRNVPNDNARWGIFNGHEMIVCDDCIENYVQSERNPDKWCCECDAILIHLQNGREVTVHPDDAIEDYCTWECVNCNQVWDDPDWDPDENEEDYYCPNCRD